MLIRPDLPNFNNEKIVLLFIDMRNFSYHILYHNLRNFQIMFPFIT